MSASQVSFSIAGDAAWAPGLASADAWAQWAEQPWRIEAGAEAPVAQMAPMLRRRAGALGKMALEVAYQCLDGRSDVPTVFCSRHGEVGRAIGLLSDLAQGEPLSPTGFGLAVHNASAGLLSIARADRANHVALCAGAATVEHAVIEACGLLADGEPLVLLVAYDAPLPQVLAGFEDCDEQPYAWAWAMTPAGEKPVTLSWSACGDDPADGQAMPGGLEVLRFHLRGEGRMERRAAGRLWSWTRDA